MTRVTFRPDWQRALVALSAVTIAAVLVGVLYWGRAILIPVALAVFFTFVLAPLVNALQRRRVPRVAAVLLVMTATGLASVGTGWVLGQQLAGLMRTLPDNAERIKGKITTVREWAGGGESRMLKFLGEIQQTIAPPAAPAPTGSPLEPPKLVVEQPTSWMTRIEPVAGLAAEVAGQAAFAFVLVVFMLLKREDLRNRLLRVIAHGRVTQATKAVDDASRRISRYLLTQLILNASFGVVISIGLLILGVEYALLWGFLATLMRYVPYIGTWIGVIPPVLFSLATTDGFAEPLVVLAFFVTLELVCNNVFEPWLYGASLGMSEVAQLMAAAFWSFLWGPIGLILSGPLTTCLVVLGKYVPQLQFLDILLGDSPPLEPGVMFFQRLAARDQDEAARVAEGAAAKKAFGVTCDTVFVPALTMTQQAAADGELEPGDEKFILAATREIAEDTADDAAGLGSGAGISFEGDRVRVLACAARHEADEVAVRMLVRLLPADKWEVNVAASETLTSELLARIAEFRPAVLCVSSLPPGGLAHTRYLCKRVNARFPELKLLVGRWGQVDELDEAKTDLTAVGADSVHTSVDEAATQLTSWLSVLQSQQKVSEVQGGTPVTRGTAVPAAVGTGRA